MTIQSVPGLMSGPVLTEHNAGSNAKEKQK